MTAQLAAVVAGVQAVQVGGEGVGGVGVAVCGGVFVELGGVAVQAACPGGVPERSQVARVGVGGASGLSAGLCEVAGGDGGGWVAGVAR
ncbi:hypothetical protein [Acrocarpospora catenulata]|uniref:hypothetical protein n=1 Tax=Acrocarpospora catenulata TaxID=2836182 RepID=UPI001BDB30D2|nr:hypothetical protein [Acrocarpospora catenulata]